MSLQEKKILEIVNQEDYQIKNLRMFSGMEGTGSGFNAKLYRKGKLIATLTNDDSGGETMWSGLSNEEEAYLKNLCSQVPPERSEYFPDLEIACDINVFVDTLVDYINNEKFWKRKCQKKTCIILSSHKRGQYTEYNAPYSHKIAAQIRQRHPDDLIEIINERYLPKVATK